MDDLSANERYSALIENQRKFNRYLIVLLGSLATFTASPIKCSPVQGKSMEPTLHHGDTVTWASKSLTSLNLEDMVVFDHTSEYGTSRYVKRIAHLPGESFSTSSGKTITLDANQYWVLGDNTKLSYDSRSFGPILYEDIIGEVTKIFHTPDCPE